jgi:hypothetical protein
VSDAPPDEVEAEARRLLRELITRLPWYAGMSTAERAKRIEEDVDHWWQIKIVEAAERLAENAPLEQTPEYQSGSQQTEGDGRDIGNSNQSEHTR